MTTSQAPMSAPGGWRVVSQVEATDRDVSGNFVPGHRVYFETASGVTGSVFLSAMFYTPDNVRAAIAAKAAIIDSIAGLSS